MPSPGDRRDDDRLRQPALALYSSGSVEGKGVLYDLSLTGARIEKASQRLEIGARLDLTFSLRGDVFPVEIAATVTRETRRGFAVRFDGLEGDAHDLLEGVIADLELRRVLEDEEDTEPTITSPGFS